ncbi:unnamed protein product [Mytilus edulis]|uniref:Uncharacterized protein n=1 Tax=Mytilus edulis TaxID=6550 RepID=A0A8S3RZ18_MYTED|nr:unnamed protein product [Mytilus edulis]
MGWDSQAMAHMSPHMFQGRHGSEMYDQMKGYSHMEGQRYDRLGVQGMHSSDMFGSTAVTGSSSYFQMSQLRPPVHSQAMLILGHPHHMMMGHGAHGMSPMSIGSAQSPPLHGSLDMFQGRHGSEMYDQMKGYSHMEGQRYDRLGVQGMHSSDMFGSTAVTGSSSYFQMSQLRPPVHSQAMLIPGIRII